MTPAEWSAIAISLKVGLWVAFLGLVPSVGLGYALARWRFRGKSVIGALALLPLVMPPVVTGLVLLSLVGRRAPLGALFASLGLPLSFSFQAAVLAALVVGFPLYVFSCRGAFEAVDPKLIELSKTLGHPPARTFWRVTLPLALPGLGAGAVLAFARGLGEFGATAILAGNREGETRTIALGVYDLLQVPGGDTMAWRLVAASAALALMALIAWDGLNRWQRRRLEIDRG